jgi:mannan endo-1,4-beta-mannosidase
MAGHRHLTTAAVCAGLLVVGTLAVASPAMATHPGTTHSDKPFVQRSGSQLRVDGKPFRFAGTNNYYLMYSSQKMTDAVLDKAEAQGFDVLRTWAWFDIGDPADPSTSVGGADKGVYFHYLDTATGAPAFNDGDNGLKKLDYVVAKAGEDNLRLVLPLTNNWSDFGGMDQYNLWRGATYHSDFYTDPVERQWFKDWISHLLNHTNAYTGVKYKDDPTIMTFELANEARCIGSGRFPKDPGCNTSTITGWAKEMSTYIKSIDHHHLVSSGTEGELCFPKSPSAQADWTRNCGEGVDELAISRLPSIDVMSYHLYPDSWTKDNAWALEWIRQHIQLAKSIGKPSMLGEFGWSDKATRNPIYKGWLDQVSRYGGNGALYWILSDVQDDGTLYPDYDGFTVYCPSPVCSTISNFAVRQRTGFSSFNPVADNDVAQTEFETAVDVPLTANDIAYHASIRPGTVDVDPSTPGRQTSGSSSSGTWAVDAGGVLHFTPAMGFNGRPTLSYRVFDSLGRASNVATVTIVVKPSPTAAQTLFDFEDGVQGWAIANFETSAATVTQSDAHSQGQHGLSIVSAGAWFTGPFADVQDLSTRSQLKVDLVSSTGTGALLSLQVGPSFQWCQITLPGFFTTPQIGDNALTFDLTTLTPDCISQLNQVHQMNLFINGGTTVIDNVQVL